MIFSTVAEVGEFPDSIAVTAVAAAGAGCTAGGCGGGAGCGGWAQADTARHGAVMQTQ